MSNAVPPGWYQDPTGTTRYWDGTQWTSATWPVGPGQMSQFPVQQYASSSHGEERNMAMLAQLLGLFTSFIGPLVMYVVAREDQPFLKHHAAEALNFQITVFIGSLICIVLALVLIGFVLMFVLVIGALVLEIMATVAANRGEWYRYPVNIRMVSGARG